MDGITETPPKDINPYTTLNLTPSASPAEIKTAYKKFALKHHPDKAEPSQKSTAHTTFQKIAFAYAILSSPHRRNLYDTTGSTSETLSNLSDDDDFNWLSFFRAQYSTDFASALDDFSTSYKNSDEERKDLLASYEKHKGKLNDVFKEIMLSNPLDDEERFREILDEAIEKGEVEGYKAYVKETQASKIARMKKARSEAEQAEQSKAEMRANTKYQSIFGGDGKGPNESSGANKENDADVNGAEPLTNRQKKAGREHGDLDNLAAMIQSRNKARGETFFDDLEAKYAGTSANGKAKKRKAKEEPDEEDFKSMEQRVAKIKAERETSVKSNSKQAKKAKVVPRSRKAEAAVVDEHDLEDEDDDEDKEIDLEKESDGSEDEEEADIAERSEEEEVKPKPKPKPKPKAKAKAQKGKAKKPTMRKSTRSRAKK
ncbi:MAG: hypothetical protein Q9166_004176 [cf. Caloplaca sp. 2 TL-2023]